MPGGKVKGYKDSIGVQNTGGKMDQRLYLWQVESPGVITAILVGYLSLLSSLTSMGWDVYLSLLKQLLPPMIARTQEATGRTAISITYALVRKANSA